MAFLVSEKQERHRQAFFSSSLVEEGQSKGM